MIDLIDRMTKSPSVQASGIIQRIANLDLVKNRYFVLGSVIGKGVSILALPLIIANFGSHNYALYVLMYTYVQVTALVSILGLNNALIPLWMDHERKDEFLALLLTLTIVISVIGFVPIAAILFVQAPLSKGVSNPVVATGLILCYAFVYNLFVIGQGLLRVQSKQLSFFWTGVASALLFVTLLLTFRDATDTGVITLALIHIVTLLFQVAMFFVFSDVPFRLRFAWRVWAPPSKAILRFSVPLAAYMLVSNIPYVVDKWIIHDSFPTDVFTTYTLNFQFAFAISIIGSIINVYNSPRICELYRRADAEGLKRNLMTNYVIVLLGTVGLGLVLYVYGLMTNVLLTEGYWVLAVTFGFVNVFALNTSFLIAEKRTILLGTIGLAGATSLVAMLMLAAAYEAPRWIYLSQLVCNTLLAVATFLTIKSNLPKNAASLVEPTTPILLSIDGSTVMCLPKTGPS